MALRLKAEMTLPNGWWLNLSATLRVFIDVDQLPR
jgi:hypothetical protein